VEVVFWKKGNEKQFRFNETVQEQIQIAEARVQEASTTQQFSSALQQATQALEESICLLKSRQKAIRLADCSEFGWLVASVSWQKTQMTTKIFKAAERKASLAHGKHARTQLPTGGLVPNPSPRDAV